MRGALREIATNGLGEHEQYRGKDEQYRVAEIGVWQGVNAEQIIRVLGDKLEAIHLVDHYEREYPYGHLEYTPELNYAMALKILKPFEDVCRWHIGDSIAVSEQFADNSLHFVYIDGCHKYEAVRADIEAWYPKVIPGCMLAGHDWQLIEVCEAATHFAEKRGLQIHTFEEDWWLYKESDSELHHL